MKEKPSFKPFHEPRNLKKGLVLSALMHAAVPAAMHASDKAHEAIGHAHELASQAQSERTDRERHEQFQTERRRLLAEAEQAIEDNNLDLGSFLISANELDLEEEGRNFDDGLIRKEYLRLVEEFSRNMGETRSVESITSALRTILADYNYTGVTGGTMAEILTSRSGSCEQISHLIVSLVYEGGFHNSIGLRFYPPPTEGGISHVAPILRYRDQHHTGQELDLADGGPAFTEGIYRSAQDLIADYREHHFPTRTTTASPARPREVRGTSNFSYPTPEPAHARSFPDGAMPLFSRGIMHAYVGRNQRSIADTVNSQAPRTERPTDIINRTYELAQHHDQAFRLIFVVEDPIITPAPSSTATEDSTVDFNLIYSFGDEEMVQVSQEIDYFRQEFERGRLEHEPDPDLKKAEAGGMLVRLYELTASHARQHGMTRLAEEADRQRLNYLSQAQAVLHGISEADILGSTSGTCESIRALMFLGEDGEQKLLNIYRTNHFRSLMFAETTLAALLLHSSTREHALVELQRLPLSDRVRTYDGLTNANNFYFSQTVITETPTGTLLTSRQINNIEMRGDDPISTEFRIHSAVFPLNFQERVYDVNPDHFIRSLVALETYIDTHIQPHAVTPEFREELILDGISRIVYAIQNVQTSSRITLLSTFAQFCREAITWVRTNRPSETILLRNIREMANPPASP